MLDSQRLPGFKYSLREFRLTKHGAVREGRRLTEIRERRFTGVRHP
jgi:hypothetical protein